MRPIASACIVTVLIAPVAPAQAQSPATFFKGKTIELHISTTSGSGYDIHGRILARHMGKYIPGNPAIVAKNYEGAGGLRLTNMLYNSAPKDGTYMGIVFRSTAFEPMMGNKAAQFDATKLTWIGSSSNETSICVSWHASGIATIDDLLKKELLMGSVSRATDTHQFAKVLNGTLGTKMKIIDGYPGGTEINLAIERGEVGGRCGWSWSAVKATRRAWVDQKRVNILVQIALTKHPELAGVPLAIDLAKTDEHRNILKLVFARQTMAWPFLAPPGLPPDRVAALRKAFMETMKDKDFLAEAAKAKLEIAPVSGEDIEKLVAELHATPPALVQKTIEVLK